MRDIFVRNWARTLSGFNKTEISNIKTILINDCFNSMGSLLEHCVFTFALLSTC